MERIMSKESSDSIISFCTPEKLILSVTGTAVMYTAFPESCYDRQTERDRKTDR